MNLSDEVEDRVYELKLITPDIIRYPKTDYAGPTRDPQKRTEGLLPRTKKSGLGFGV